MAPAGDFRPPHALFHRAKKEREINGETGDGEESASAFGHVTDVSEVKGGEDTKARPDRTFFPSYLWSCCLFSEHLWLAEPDRRISLFQESTFE